MDILHLVDRLEELLNESRPIPLTHSVVVDEDRVLEIIDQMRISIPDEVKKSQQVLAQRDRRWDTPDHRPTEHDPTPTTQTQAQTAGVN